jgi:hypothetical protein
MRAARTSWFAIAVWFIAIFPLLQGSGRSLEKEQAIFGIENEITHPVPLPKDVLRILSADDRVGQCLRMEGLADPSASMFVAAEIHLHSAQQSDLVVLPKADCLSGANIGPIWVFGNLPGGYQLILKTDALGIVIQRHKTLGYRDIKGVQGTANRTLTALFKFDGHRYQTTH